jgi:hypothetical protein
LTGKNHRGVRVGAALFALLAVASTVLSLEIPGLANAQQGPGEPDMVVRSFLPRVTVDTEAPPDVGNGTGGSNRQAPGIGAGVDPGSGCPLLIKEALGEEGCMISFCESGWNPNATGSAGERGWFQISPIWHHDSTYDPAGNVAAALRISRGGTDWSAWTVVSVLETGVCPGGVAYPG